MQGSRVGDVAGAVDMSPRNPDRTCRKNIKRADAKEEMWLRKGTGTIEAKRSITRLSTYLHFNFPNRCRVRGVWWLCWRWRWRCLSLVFVSCVGWCDMAGESGVYVHRPPYLLATDRSSTYTQIISFFLPFCTSGPGEPVFAENETRKGRNHGEFY